MELMLFDLIAGFFLRLFFIICWKVARFTVHHAWGAVVHHPFLVAIAFGAARRAGWFDDSAAVVFWAPYVIACLLLCAGIRVLSHHPPKDIAEAAKRHVREVQKWGAGVNTAREWVADRRREGKPPPPEQGTHRSVVDENGDGLMDAMAAAVPNGADRPGTAGPPAPTPPGTAPAVPGADVLDVQEVHPSAGQTPEVIYLGPPMEVTS